MLGSHDLVTAARRQLGVLNPKYRYINKNAQIKDVAKRKHTLECLQLQRTPSLLGLVLEAVQGKRILLGEQNEQTQTNRDAYHHLSRLR
jgi:hypothetical protein